MWLQRLKVEGIRNLTGVDLTLCRGINVFTGANGAGKTSILEAVHCLATGRSFRPAGRAEYLSRDLRSASLFAEVCEADKISRLGMQRKPDQWQARLNGDDVASLSELARALAVMAFHPRLHQLIEGPPEERRRFLDFGVFHVEHGFLLHWRAYRLALRQRNAALRNGYSHDQVTSWDPGLAESGQKLTKARQEFVALLEKEFSRILKTLNPAQPTVSLSLASGWTQDLSLLDALSGGVERDLSRGHTGQGPHRADLKISSEGLAVSGRLSRGQQKLVALSLTLALLKVLDQQVGIKPVFCFDDFASELDVEHQALVLDTVCGLGCQVLLTGNQQPVFSDVLCVDKKMFHVEQGKVVEVV